MKFARRGLSILLSAVILCSATPVFAGSIGSVANDKAIGSDPLQNAVTTYGSVDMGGGGNSTDVYLTVDNSQLIVGVPTTVILNGEPNENGKYEGDYSIYAKGDIAGDQTLNIYPETDTVVMRQKGKLNKEAEIKQDLISFVSADIVDGMTTTGTISAESLSAGSWNGNFNFVISMIDKAVYYSSIELAVADANNLTTENADVKREDVANAEAALYVNEDSQSVRIRLLKDANDVDTLSLTKDASFDLNGNTLTVRPNINGVTSSKSLDIFDGTIKTSGGIALSTVGNDINAEKPTVRIHDSLEIIKATDGLKEVRATANFSSGGVEQGFLYAKNCSADELIYDYAGENTPSGGFVKKWVTTAESARLTFGIASQTGVASIRGYVAYLDENNDLQVIYTKIISYDYDSGTQSITGSAFDTGESLGMAPNESLQFNIHDLNFELYDISNITKTITGIQSRSVNADISNVNINYDTNYLCDVLMYGIVVSNGLSAVVRNSDILTSNTNTNNDGIRASSSVVLENLNVFVDSNVAAQGVGIWMSSDDADSYFELNNCNVYGKQWGIQTSVYGSTTINGGIYTSTNHTAYICGNADIYNAEFYIANRENYSTLDEAYGLYCGGKSCPSDAVVNFYNCTIGNPKDSTQQHASTIVAQKNYGYISPAEINIYDCNLYQGKSNLFLFNRPHKWNGGTMTTKFNLYGNTKLFDVNGVEITKEEFAEIIATWKDSIHLRSDWQSIGNNYIRAQGESLYTYDEETDTYTTCNLADEANVYDYR